MLVFIDESGDPGIGTGSKYLVMALSKAKIRIDGKTNNRVKRYLKAHKYILNENNPGTIETIEMYDSRKDNLIQLADMVVGAIARSLHPEKKDQNRWRRKLKLKSRDLLFY